MGAILYRNTLISSPKSTVPIQLTNGGNLVTRRALATSQDFLSRTCRHWPSSFWFRTRAAMCESANVKTARLHVQCCCCKCPSHTSTRFSGNQRSTQGRHWAHGRGHFSTFQYVGKQCSTVGSRQLGSSRNQPQLLRFPLALSTAPKAQAGVMSSTFSGQSNLLSISFYRADDSLNLQTLTVCHWVTNIAHDRFAFCVFLEKFLNRTSEHCNTLLRVLALN